MPKKTDVSKESPGEINFTERVWKATAIIVFIVSVLVLFIYTFNVLLLILAGALIAVFFRALSSKIQRATKWKESLSVATAILSTLLIVGLLFFLIGAKVQDQVVELMDTLPKTIEEAKASINESSIGQKIYSQVFSESTTEKAQVFLPSFFKSTFGVLGDLYVVFFIGIFFTISPQLYIKGFIQIIPPQGQPKAQEVLDTLGEQLRKWLKGTFLSMFVVFLLTAIGLAIIGMPLWLVLALLAGIICFIPNFGPLLALIPAVLVALTESTQTAMIVLGLYVLIQFIESNFITTAIQKKMINMPPALILISQLFMAALTGVWGLILATPLILIIIVLVQELYIKDRETDQELAVEKD